MIRTAVGGNRQWRKQRLNFGPLSLRIVSNEKRLTFGAPEISAPVADDFKLVGRVIFGENSLLIPMEKPAFSHHSAREFREWNELQSLVISPKFQRREVWKTPARSFFIDSVLRDIPIPPIFLRLTQTPDRKRVIREVIDGQQRLRALLDYLADKYALSRSLDPHGGKKFSELPQASQEQIEGFNFLCEVFQQITDAEVLEVFARVNTYSVGLNAQELRNGRYFGRFKQCAYALALEHLEVWRKHKIFSENAIARMLEVELTSELMIAELDGMQDKKKSIDKFYMQFDESFPDGGNVASQFRSVIDTLMNALSDALSKTEFTRPPLFYSLFCVVYHRIFGLPRITLSTPARHLKSEEQSRLRDALIELSNVITSAKQEPVQQQDAAFVSACLRQTDNIKPRLIRFETLYMLAFPS